MRILLLAGNIPRLLSSFGASNGPLVIILLICIGILAAVIIAQFGVVTRQRRLDEVSP